ncbi:MAG: helix-turn-helix domain-containing protein [Anaerolineae bacterium]|nr:helix-turn-helix domain-containing protein [Anaerolineae bacterium]
MSRTIHGKSTAALKHLRKAPAALAVYWCYVARMNNEGVAWPSSRGLQTDTGWNRNTCAEARTLLVELGALEELKDYIRPEWRKLQPAALAQKKNLDQAEYYRPTGKLVVDGKAYPMLYIGADDDNPIDADGRPDQPSKIPDGLRHRPSTPSTVGGVDHRPDRPELDSSIELDSKKTQLDSSPIPAPNGAGASPDWISAFFQALAAFAKAELGRDLAFEAICRDLFGIEHTAIEDKSTRGRINGLAKTARANFQTVYQQHFTDGWTRDLEEKLARAIPAFVKSWRAAHADTAVPLARDKFGTAFLKFLQTYKPDRKPAPAAASPPPVVQPLTAAEQTALAEARKTIRPVWEQPTS